MTTTAEWNPFNRNCPSRQVLDRIGDRWSVLILVALSHGPMRYTELSRRIDGVSQKMLTQTLRGLERDGLVTRTVHAAVPPKVEYELTESGRTLTGPLAALDAWARTHIEDVVRSRLAYDEPQASA